MSVSLEHRVEDELTGIHNSTRQHTVYLSPNQQPVERSGLLPSSFLKLKGAKRKDNNRDQQYMLSRVGNLRGRVETRRALTGVKFVRGTFF